MTNKVSYAIWLRQMVEEIRSEGHNGWGNTATHAADFIDEQQTHIDTYQAAIKARHEAGECGCQTYMKRGEAEYPARTDPLCALLQEKG